MKTGKNLTLAIETAIEGGSISILDGAAQIDFRIGDHEISKAEDVLENVSKLLKRNRLKKESIGMIVVSSDTGSATGLKIGLATAKGLATALQCRLLIVSLLDSLTKSIAPPPAERYVIALPVGKNNIFRQYRRFLTDEKPFGEFSIVKCETFFKELLTYEGVIYTHQSIAKMHLEMNGKIAVNLGENLAFTIGKTSYVNNASDNEAIL